MILFLITTLPVSSQISLTDTVECSVPCRSLKKAIETKYHADYLQRQLVIVRDSVGYYGGIVSSMDTMLQYRDSQIIVLRDTETQYKKQLKVRDDQIQTLITKARIGFVTAGATFIFSLLLLL